MAETAPINESQRIESLDVLRGFALLGILLLNIIGFGFIASAYVAPGLTLQSPADVAAWIFVELTAEGAMRGLFSILFGAGVALFIGRDDKGRSGLHMKRTFWLLIFGLLNGYLLLWTGDILVSYAVCGFILFCAKCKRKAAVDYLMHLYRSSQPVQRRHAFWTFVFAGFGCRSRDATGSGQIRISRNERCPGGLARIRKGISPFRDSHGRRNSGAWRFLFQRFGLDHGPQYRSFT